MSEGQPRAQELEALNGVVSGFGSRCRAETAQDRSYTWLMAAACMVIVVASSRSVIDLLDGNCLLLSGNSS
jgi:hypothetical protein